MRVATGTSPGSLVNAGVETQGAEQGAPHPVPIPEQPSTAIATGAAISDRSRNTANTPQPRISLSLSHAGNLLQGSTQSVAEPWWVLDDVGGGERRAMVPRAAVQSIGTRTVVYVPMEEAGRFLEKPVTLGAAVGDAVQVLNGLTPGDKVLTEGSFCLRAEAARLRSSS